MKYILMLSVLIPAAIAQTPTSSIAGTVLDAKTLKPVPAALVRAVSTAGCYTNPGQYRQLVWKLSMPSNTRNETPMSRTTEERS